MRYPPEELMRRHGVNPKAQVQIFWTLIQTQKYAI